MTTITIDRSEYDRLVADSEMLADLSAFDAAMKDRGEGMPMEVFTCIINGENPVRVIREWRGLAQADLARRAGLHRVQVHDVETGKPRGSVNCVFRSIRPPIPTTCAHLFRGIRPPVMRCREAACFSYQIWGVSSSILAMVLRMD